MQGEERAKQHRDVDNDVPVDDVRSQGRHGASLACVRASPVHASP